MPKLRVLYISGNLAAWPKRLRPLPPLDSGAPHNNIVRLTEYLGEHYSDTLDLLVVSPTMRSQIPEMELKWPRRERQAHYETLTISDRLRRTDATLTPSTGRRAAALRRLTRYPTLQAWNYLAQCARIYREFNPDMVVLDDGPQYIPGVLKFTPREKLVFFCRAEVGMSRVYLHLPRLVLVTNSEFGEWVKSVNSQVTEYVIVHNTLAEHFAQIEWREDRFNATPPYNIVFAGRIVPVKGVEYLIRAFAKVHAKLQNRVKLTLIGAEHPTGKARTRGQQVGFEASMRQLTAELLPPDAVDWKGWLSLEELLEVMKDSYMAVYPSTWIEGFGMVALEAMACGLPVVASDRPGFRSLLGDGGGILVDDPTNLNEMAEAILHLLENPEDAERLARTGYEIAHEYTLANAAQQFIKAVEVCTS